MRPFHFVYAFAIALHVALAQQVFTPSLAIINSPQPGTTLRTGQELSFAVDVSANGRVPISGDATATSAILSLEVYLIGGRGGSRYNWTVAGPGLMGTEPESTVKHPRARLPSCLPGGPASLTLYELSMINSAPFFTIFSIPVTVERRREDGEATLPCEGVTEAVEDGQEDSRPPSPIFSSAGDLLVPLSTGLRVAATDTQLPRFAPDDPSSSPVSPSLTDPSPSAPTPTTPTSALPSPTPQRSVTLTLTSTFARSRPTLVTTTVVIPWFVSSETTPPPTLSASRTITTVVTRRSTLLSTAVDSGVAIPSVVTRRQTLTFESTATLVVAEGATSTSVVNDDGSVGVFGTPLQGSSWRSAVSMPVVIVMACTTGVLMASM